MNIIIIIRFIEIDLKLFYEQKRLLMRVKFLSLTH